MKNQSFHFNTKLIKTFTIFLSNSKKIPKQQTRQDLKIKIYLKHLFKGYD